jgi:hypothetical protein
MAVVFVSLAGCAGASVTPLAPEGSASSEPEAAHHDKVSRGSSAAPEASRAEPGGNAAAPASASASASAPPPEPSPAAVSAKGAVTIQLLGAGAEPRKALRYVFHQGESIPFRMRIDMVMDMTVSAPTPSSTQAPRSIHQILPTIECGGVTNTKRVDADGTAHRNGSFSGMSVIGRPGVQPEIQAKMEEMLRGVGNLPFDDVIDTRGQISDSHMDLSAVHEPKMLESMQQMTDSMSALTLTWPTEPVGVGAKWEIVSNFGQGKSFARDVIVTLVSVKGSKLKLEMTSTVTGAPRTVVTSGTAVHLGATSSTGTGKLEISLDPLLTHSTSTTRLRTDSSANGLEIQTNLELVAELHSGQ